MTGAGGLSLTPTAVYADNLNAGHAVAGYTYAGDANHLRQQRQRELYDRQGVVHDDRDHCRWSVHLHRPAKTPATVTVTGAGGLSLTPTAVYADNLNAGIDRGQLHLRRRRQPLRQQRQRDLYDRQGDVHDDGDHCRWSVHLHRLGDTPATVAVTGVGGLSLTPDGDLRGQPSTPALLAASYTYAGDANHLGSSDSVDFTIDKASSTTAVTIVGGPFTYTGAAIRRRR